MPQKFLFILFFIYNFILHGRRKQTSIYDTSNVEILETKHRNVIIALLTSTFKQLHFTCC